MEKGNLEVVMFSIRSKQLAANQRPFLPLEGLSLPELNRAWEDLERSEHERELALREELIRYSLCLFSYFVISGSRLSYLFYTVNSV